MDTQSFSKTPNIIEESSVTDKFQIRNVSDTVGNKKPLRDFFLDDTDDFEDAEIYYPSKMNETPDKSDEEMVKEPETKSLVQAFLAPENTPVSTSVLGIKDYEPSPFILANTIEAELHHLRNDCIIPVFSKDNEKTIAHQEFIDCVVNATQKAFPMQSITTPEIRVSHQIKGKDSRSNS